METKAKQIVYKAYQQWKLDSKIFGDESSESFESYREYRAIEKAMSQLLEIDSYDLYRYCVTKYTATHA